jgi:mannose-1-phosphate guanylyltransferase/mannose-6-phosphate isomerase
MERTRRAAVMPVSYGWSDVGSWQAVWELSSHDEFGNSVTGFRSDRQFTATPSRPESSVSLIGIENLVIVVTEDAVLVSKRKAADELRQLTCPHPSHCRALRRFVRLSRRLVGALDEPLGEFVTPG